MNITFRQPIKFIAYNRIADVVEYGFRFDLTTEITGYHYEWGFGFTCVLFGFGFELNVLAP